jgi:uncharacterized membrane protein YtjA (UPF0391 family)
MAVEPARQRFRRWGKRVGPRTNPNSEVAITRRNRRARGEAAPQLGSGRGRAVLYWLLLLVVLAVVTGILGFGGVAQGAAEAGQILFAIAVGLLVITLIVGALRSRRAE